MSSGRTQVLYAPSAQQSQKVGFTVTAGSSAALPQYCDAVELMATQDCHIEFLTGAANEGTASATVSAFIKSGVLYRYACPKGSTDCKVNVVRDSADGNLFITPLTQ